MRHPGIGKLPLTITGKHTTADTLTLSLGGMLVAGMVAIAGCGGGGSSAAADTTAPIFSSGASASFAENGTGTAYDATADNDIGITYTLAGTDATQFAISASNGAVTFLSSPDYEIPTDSGGNNVYDITVTATDAAGNTTNQAVAIAVTNVVEAGETDTTAPIFSSGASASFAENGTGTAYDATADNDSGVTYTLGGTDAAQFAVNASNGAVTFLSSPNYEIPTDSGGNNVYNIIVTATDAAGNATNQAVAIMVTNVVEAGETDTTAPIFSSGASASFAENGTGTAYDATADNDIGITYTQAGTDAAKFAINASNGAVTFVTSPDYEMPTDSGGNNVYDITITATDVAGNATNQAVAIAVTNVVEAGQTDTTAPIFSSGASASFAENGAGTAYDATADNDIGITYTQAGTDAAKFAVNASSGAVTFVTPPDYEIPTDSGGNNVYDITVTATDAAGNATNQAVAITVTNVVEAGDAPTTTLTAASIASNGNATVQSSEIGTAYLVKNTLAVSSLADITAAADNQWNSAAITAANSDTVLSAAGLQAGAYKLFTANAIGRLSAAASSTVVVTNTIDANRIDLGAYGNLIAPVYVDGNWYFHWDRSGDGTSNDIGSLNGGLDYVARDVLDGIFANDINGVANTTVINTDGNYGTTDTYRYATLNGIKVALPTTNGSTAYPNGINNYQPGTAIDNIPAGETNPAYNDLLAIWDAYNSTGTGTIIFGAPPGWKFGGYLSATPSWSGHAFVVLTTGYIYDYNDLVNDFVALQVL